MTGLTTLTMSNNQVSDITPLSGLTNLEILMLDHNRISDIRPLRTLLNLEHLNVENNQISDITPLLGWSIIDNGDAGYAEMSDGWTGNANDNAFNSDYRIHPGEKAVAEWHFDGLVPGESYELFITWPEHESRSDQVAYSTGKKWSVRTLTNQQFIPAGPVMGGVPWQSLGMVKADSQGHIGVRLDNHGQGTVAVDAVWVVSQAELSTINATEIDVSAALVTDINPGSDGSALVQFNWEHSRIVTVCLLGYQRKAGQPVNSIS